MRTFLVVTTLAVALASAVEAGEKCPLGLCKGERVILYNEDHRRVGTLENRGYGVLQLRDNDNRRIGTIEGNGVITDNQNRRQGSFERDDGANKWGAGSFWK